MYLNQYDTRNYSIGAPFIVAFFWHIFGYYFIKNRTLDGHIYGRKLKVSILRIFGAKIGKDVLIRADVKIKLPWRLHIGDYVWIGENVWIDNSHTITIGDNVCISQGAYLCTGNHDWTDTSFKVKLGEINIADGAWIGANAVIGPNVNVGEGAILTLASVTSKNLDPMYIYTGHPAQKVKKRIIKNI